ncbi:hypothetical protein EYF80_043962 [Liparis tanakae]|uniref:Uncharacterized protein n=1 Tax=Liparis tanakae TaxID=230148 RepID=A0A4Z2FX66_9TELE|nr:hypothetical protein EYF80_043962 [Liparis tanakae]
MFHYTASVVFQGVTPVQHGENTFSIQQFSAERENKDGVSTVSGGQDVDLPEYNYRPRIGRKAPRSYLWSPDHYGSTAGGFDC